jgi:hypothetical protein
MSSAAISLAWSTQRKLKLSSPNSPPDVQGRVGRRGNLAPTALKVELALSPLSPIDR